MPGIPAARPLRRLLQLAALLLAAVQFKHAAAAQPGPLLALQYTGREHHAGQRTRVAQLTSSSSLQAAAKALAEETKRSVDGVVEAAVQHDDPSGYLAMCLIVKDQHRDIREWLDYHLAVGASHAIIYDDASQPPISTVLYDYIEAELVTVIELNKSWLQGGAAKSAQVFAYITCHESFGDRFHWMAFIDTDEFLVLDQAAGGAASLPEYLQRYEDYSALAVNQRVFGSSGHVARPKGGVARNYVKCIPKGDSAFNSWFKSIVNTRHAGPPAWWTPHYPTVCDKYKQDGRPPCVDTQKRPIIGFGTMSPCLDELVLYHYTVKSWQDFEDKQRRGSAMGNPSWKEHQFRFVDTNATDDCTLLARRAHVKVTLQVPLDS